MDKKKIAKKAINAKTSLRNRSNSGGSSNSRGSSTRNNRTNSNSAGRKSGGKLKYILIAVLVLAVGFALNHFGMLDNVIPAPAEGYVWVHFIDVGQGDAILVRTADNAVLIDSGPRSAESSIIEYLQSLGITTLDVVVGTHPHADHIGSKQGILNTFEVLEVWMPDVTHTTATFERFIDAIYQNDIEVNLTTAGDRLQAGQIQMTAIAPGTGGHGNLNDYSIVLHMQFGQTAFLFTADAELYTENKILAAGTNIRSDVMLVGHHGSRSSSSDAFLDAIRPSIGVVSVGAGNRYGHPHQVVTDRLDERNIEILRTDLLGTVVLVTDGTTVRRYN